MNIFRRVFSRARVEAVCGPLNAWHTISAILPWVLFLGTVIALAVGWDAIPDRIPMQTDFSGNITGWGSKTSLIWLGVVYFVIVLTLWLTGWFPNSWNTSVRIGTFRPGRNGNDVRSYRLTLDLLCDLRVVMSALFSALLLVSAFGEPGRFLGWIGPLTIASIVVPLLRFLIRMYILK